MKKYCLNCNTEKSKKGKYCKPCGYKFRIRPKGIVMKNIILKNTYAAVHYWIYSRGGRPKECEFCGISKNLVWANKSFEYKRDLSDWLRLCAKCHNNYDRENGWGRAAKKFGAWT